MDDEFELCSDDLLPPRRWKSIPITEDIDKERRIKIYESRVSKRLPVFNIQDRKSSVVEKGISSDFASFLASDEYEKFSEDFDRKLTSEETAALWMGEWEMA